MICIRLALQQVFFVSIFLQDALMKIYWKYFFAVRRWLYGFPETNSLQLCDPTVTLVKGTLIAAFLSSLFVDINLTEITSAIRAIFFFLEVV